MLRRIRRQAILLDRFWAAIRNDPRRRTLPAAGLDPEIADLATRLSAESRTLAPTVAFRTDLRERIEAATQAPPQRRAETSLAQTDRALPDAAFVADDERIFTRRHPAAEWARFIAAALAFFVVGGLLVVLLGDTYESDSLGSSATSTPTTDPTMGASIPPEVPAQIPLNSGRPSWGMAMGAESIWVGTVTGDGSAVVRAAQTGRLGGEVQATISLPGRVWDVAYGHGSVWATVIGDSLTGEGSAVVRIDPATNAITETIPLGAQPTDILIDDNAVWVTDLGEPTVWRVDPAENTVVATIELGEPGDENGVILAKTDDALWALASHVASGVELVWIDPTKNAVAAATMLPEIENVIGEMAGTSGTLWIATASNSLIRFNVWTGEIVKRIDLHGMVREIVADDDYVWVATIAWSPDGSELVEGWLNALTLIDAPSGRVHSVYNLHDDVPWALAVGEQRGSERVWISLNSEADQQARLRGQYRPSGIAFNPYPPTATAVGVVSTAVPSPSASPSPTRVPPTSTPGLTATVPVESVPAGEITATFEFVGALGQPAWGAGALWVPNWSFGAVERIDGETGETTRVQVSAPGLESNGVWMCLAADDNAVWVSDNTIHELVRIDTETSEIVARIPLGEITPFPAWIESIAVGEGAVWVILDDSEIVVRIDPASNTVAAVIDAPGARGMVVGRGAVWVHNVYTAEILRIDPATNEIVATISTGTTDIVVMSLAIGAGAVWVEVGDTGTIAAIDPAANTITATTGVLGIDQGSMTADDSSVWAIFVRTPRLVRIDPQTLEARTLDIAAPSGVAVGGGSVWVTTAAGSPNTIVRIAPAP
jgi:DNA-binding beta-propeller fold protein YncE